MRLSHIPAHHRRHIVKKVKPLTRHKHHRLSLMIVIIAISYIAFSQPVVTEAITTIPNLGYLTTFLGGILFAIGFTTPIGIALFLINPPSNLLLGAVIGGIGSTLGDYAIFKTVKTSMMDEFQSLENNKYFKKMIKELDKDIPQKIRTYLLYTFIGIILASPLPDEIGVTLLAGLTTTKMKHLALLSFILHTIGIFVLLWIATLL